MDLTGFSDPSITAVFATSAAQASVSTLKIWQQTGHVSEAMIGRNVRDGEPVASNAAG